MMTKWPDVLQRGQLKRQWLMCASSLLASGSNASVRLSRCPGSQRECGRHRWRAGLGMVSQTCPPPGLGRRLRGRCRCFLDLPQWARSKCRANGGDRRIGVALSAGSARGDAPVHRLDAGGQSGACAHKATWPRSGRQGRGLGSICFFRGEGGLQIAGTYLQASCRGKLHVRFSAGLPGLGGELRLGR